MTDKEIINGLYEIKNWKCDGDSKMHSIISEAIMALEQQPCEDAISRQAVKDILDARGVKAIMTFEHFKELLDDLPSVNPKPKTRHWIKHNTGHSVYYDCSRCGCAAPCMETADSFVWKMSKFCPNCGAKMESEVQE